VRALASRCTPASACVVVGAGVLVRVEAGTLLFTTDDLVRAAGSGVAGGLEPREGMLSREGLCEPLPGGVFAPPLLGPPEAGFLTLLKLRLTPLGFFLSAIDFLPGIARY